jgi:hypothetical protein
MSRGGARSGKSGKAYGNRTDLQGVKTATGLPYGEAKALSDAQRTIPLPNMPAGGPMAAPAAASSQMPALPGQQPFMRPTERPNEPVTTGLPTGAGPGPEVLQGPTGGPDEIGAQLRALYQQAPNNDLLRLLELHDQGY